MKKLLLTVVLALSLTASANTSGPFVITQLGNSYTIYNPTPRWAACRVTFPNGMWQDFWLQPNTTTFPIPYFAAWYCELR